MPNELWKKYSTLDIHQKKNILFLNELLNNLNNDFYNNEINIDNLKTFLLTIRNTKFHESPQYNIFKTLIKSV